MNKPDHPTSNVFRLNLIVAIAMLVYSAGREARGEVYSWDGGGVDNNWGSGSNWVGDLAPTNTGLDEVRLIGGVRLTPIVNFNNPWFLDNLTYTSLSTQSFTLGGNPLSFEGNTPVTVQDFSVSQTINNNIICTADTATFWSGNTRTLYLGGQISSNSTVNFAGRGHASIPVAEIKTGASVAASVVEVTAFSADFGPVILQLDHANALQDEVQLILTPSSDLTKYGKINLNFSSAQSEVVGGLSLDGVVQPPGIYNAANQPNYFTGTGNLLVSAPPPSGTFTWDGGGLDDNWTTATNWAGNVAPHNTGLDEVRLSGTVRPRPLVNGAYKPWRISNFMYTSTAAIDYVLDGNPLSLEGSAPITVQDFSASQTINNDIVCVAPSVTLWTGLGKTLNLGGKVSAAWGMYLTGQGHSATVSYRVTSGGMLVAPTLDVSAATANYGHVILQLDHEGALFGGMTLSLTPSTDLSKYGKVNLNYSGTQVISGLVLNGEKQPEGIYNASSQPNYLMGTGNLQVMFNPDPAAAPLVVFDSFSLTDTRILGGMLNGTSSETGARLWTATTDLVFQDLQDIDQNGNLVRVGTSIGTNAGGNPAASSGHASIPIIAGDYVAGTDTLHVEADVKPASTANPTNWIGIGLSNSTGAWNASATPAPCALLRANGDIVFSASGTAGAPSVSRTPVTGGYTFNDGDFNYVEIALNTATKTATLSVNGSPVSGASITYTALPVISSAVMGFYQQDTTSGADPAAVRNFLIRVGP